MLGLVAKMGGIFLAGAALLYVAWMGVMWVVFQLTGVYFG